MKKAIASLESDYSTIKGYFMKAIDDVFCFLDLMQADSRIGPVHISLYVAILQSWEKQGRPAYVTVGARMMMPRARICGTNLYHRTIRQLHAYGYIVYEPSFDPAVGSRVWFNLKN